MCCCQNVFLPMETRMLRMIRIKIPEIILCKKPLNARLGGFLCICKNNLHTALGIYFALKQNRVALFNGHNVSNSAIAIEGEVFGCKYF